LAIGIAADRQTAGRTSVAQAFGRIVTGVEQPDLDLLGLSQRQGKPDAAVGVDPDAAGNARTSCHRPAYLDDPAGDARPDLTGDAPPR
jgi:hypothetical protein